MPDVLTSFAASGGVLHPSTTITKSETLQLAQACVQALGHVLETSVFAYNSTLQSSAPAGGLAYGCMLEPLVLGAGPDGRRGQRFCRALQRPAEGQYLMF